MADKPEGLISPSGRKIETKKRYQMPYKALAELLIKHHGIHEGIWSIELKMLVRVQNILFDEKLSEEKEPVPGIITGVAGVDLVQIPYHNERSVNAELVNPAPGRENIKPGDKEPEKISFLN